MGAYDCDCINNLEYDRRERKERERLVKSQSTTGQLNDGVRSTARSTELIDRQAAIDTVNAMRFSMEKMAFEIITTKLLELPPAQPEPHEGHWINTSPGYKNGFYSNSYYCSECHDYYTTSPYEMKFCPNCGARMRGEQNEQH